MPTAATETDNRKMPAELLCESCGAEFLCGANVGECWCFALEMNAEDLNDLRGKFKNCLCEDCLNETKAHGLLERK